MLLLEDPRNFVHNIISNNAALIVNPIPNAPASPASQSICSGVAIAPSILPDLVGGTTYNWTRDNNGNVSGIGASGSGNISGVLNNNTTTRKLWTLRSHQLQQAVMVLLLMRQLPGGTRW